MECVTFEFKSKINWLGIYNALNDTGYEFASYGYKTISVWGEQAINEVRNACKENRISFKEI
jgi:hypothetical protein